MTSPMCLAYARFLLKIIFFIYADKTLKNLQAAALKNFTQLSHFYRASTH